MIERNVYNFVLACVSTKCFTLSRLQAYITQNKMLYVYKHLNNPDWVDAISPLRFKFLRDYEHEKNAGRNIKQFHFKCATWIMISVLFLNTVTSYVRSDVRSTPISHKILWRRSYKPLLRNGNYCCIRFRSVLLSNNNVYSREIWHTCNRGTHEFTDCAWPVSWWGKKKNYKPCLQVNHCKIKKNFNRWPFQFNAAE